MIWAPTGAPVFNCPCCDYPTLGERGGFEICRVCRWDDEFVDYTPPEEIIGGANGDYSMKEALENFAEYGQMYRPSDSRFVTDPEELQNRWKILKVTAEIKRSGPTEELYRELQGYIEEKLDRYFAKNPSELAGLVDPKWGPKK